MGVCYTWLFEIVGLLHLSTWDCMLHLTIYQRLCVCYISDTVSVTLDYMWLWVYYTYLYEIKSVTLYYMKL